MEKTIKIRQSVDGTVSVSDDLEGTDRSRTFDSGGSRDEFAEHVAGLLSDLDRLVPKTGPSDPAPETASDGPKENTIAEQTQDAAE